MMKQIKRITILMLLVCVVGFAFGQVSGNVNYETGNVNYNNPIEYSENNINIDDPSRHIYLSVKGLMNVKADTYVAVFSVTQTGKTTEEVNRLLDERIRIATTPFKGSQVIETYVDMISFVPMYEYEQEKKVFSKKTYNEVPKGFELKKNIHVKYSNADDLEKIISTFSDVEIYDLVRVDYVATGMEEHKNELATKARTLLKEKVKSYEELLSKTFTSEEKFINDGFKIALPTERYQSYEAHNSSSLTLRKSAKVNSADKSRTMYYQPIMDKEFDFVINPVVVEPVVQVMYEIKLTIIREEPQPDKGEPTNKYLIITPNGDVRKLSLNE